MAKLCQPKSSKSSPTCDFAVLDLPSYAWILLLSHCLLCFVDADDLSLARHGVMIVVFWHQFASLQRIQGHRTNVEAVPAPRMVRDADGSSQTALATDDCNVASLLRPAGKR